MLKTGLACIHTNIIFVAICNKVTKHGKFVVRKKKEINDVQNEVDKIKGSETDAIKQKLFLVLSKVKGLKSCVLEGAS
jgi:hypothetical protein